MSSRFLLQDSWQRHSLSQLLCIEIDSKQSNTVFIINLLAIQNFIKIPFTDTSKTPKSSRHFF